MANMGGTSDEPEPVAVVEKEPEKPKLSFAPPKTTPTPPAEEKKEEEKKPNLFGGIASALKKTDSGNTSGGFSFNFGGGEQPAPSGGAAASKPFSFAPKSDGEAPKVTSVTTEPAKTGGFSFASKEPPKNETPGEMVQRLEREKMNADIAKASASGKFTFGAAAPTSGSTSNNTGFGDVTNNTGFGGFGGGASSSTASTFSFGVSSSTSAQPTKGQFRI